MNVLLSRLNGDSSDAGTSRWADRIGHGGTERLALL